METNEEVETKFELPESINEEELINRLKEIFLEESWKVSSDRSDRRNYLYYDTPDFEVYKRGETIRRVGGFDTKKERGGFRYDYKTGPMDCRLEKKYWNERVLGSDEIIKGLSLPFKQIVPVAPVETYHRLLDIKKDKPLTLIEVKFDDYNLFGGDSLKELELEVIFGDEKPLQDLSTKLEKRLGLNRTEKQKYTRIVDIKKLRREDGASWLESFSFGDIPFYFPF